MKDRNNICIFYLLIIQMEERIKYLDEIFKNSNNVEKKIHITWKNKNILTEKYSLIRNGIYNLKNQNPEYEFIISNDEEIDEYLKMNMHEEDYNLIKGRHIVEKTDLWRLFKIYNEGGVYSDIDRLHNIPLKNLIKDDVKCILPMHQSIDFSQDIMISCSKNIIHKRAIELNLERRRKGCKNILYLGPITYFHAATEIILGYQIERRPSKENLDLIREIIGKSKYISTYNELPKYNLLTYQGPPVEIDKKEFYKSQDVKHWTDKF